ncbi:UDP-N-acetylmuramate--L-alanine ligase [bacterium]|nr:UDP-N-acetylmuramate--L-alanine ligase [bacterium]MDB4301534.1 UDP-N-acetylmuramate--L-alanine ligase [Akkermansiaceae bacterium]MDB4307508.1 UDP-N-acetylmuramate--L-alanine ligase [Akkermansiaceae bacterium]MDB4310287.1 UDP-N-acetylmuramate--L-alanine ligase [Akkermansiaceae bacterium]MDB4325753.1 UDP-N-acetylmuramate--L-alanine ligase [Akkermansiaceae bacterium]
MKIDEFSKRLLDREKPMRIHLIGVAGSGMSGLARLLLEMGHVVSGSDRVTSGETERLRERGLSFSTPHSADAVRDAEVVVYSSAIRDTNPALAAAHFNKTATFRRAECLAAILHTKSGVVVSGTHGKTTTSSMVAHILRKSDLTPCHYVGAEIPVLGSNAEWNEEGEYLVAEGDESDGTLALYKPKHSIVLNVEEEHLDFYTRGIEQIREVFTTLLDQTSGSIIYCGECEEATHLCSSREKSISYGWSDADWTATDISEQIGTTSFTVHFKGQEFGRVQLGIAGRHNVLNSLGAIAIGHLCGVDFQKIARALGSFAGAKRRFETKYLTKRCRIVDDYGHHPTEVAATLQTARTYDRSRVVVLFQPHRYSRTQKLADDFGKALQAADLVFVTSVYAASEDPIEGVSGQTIVDAIHANGDTKAVYLPDLSTAHHVVGNALQYDDLFITLGAGNVHEAGNKLIADLKILDEIVSDSGVETIRLYEPMAKHTTLRVGGPAQFWIEPSTFESFAEAVIYCKARGIPVRVVGRGSNLLVRDGGIRGAVIHPKGGIFSEVTAEGNTITAGAGARFKKLSSVAREHGIGGFEWMEGIPGNVGGGLRMNAGAMRVETFDQVISVTFLDEDGKIRTRDEIKSSYRSVPELRRNYALAATFKGSSAGAENIQELLDESRHHRNTTQPKAASAGCIFKNPEVMGAGRLIDELGLKETGVGKAEVSPEHGNFIVNRGKATASNVLALIDQIKAKAKAERGVDLDTEVQILGEDEFVF